MPSSRASLRRDCRASRYCDEDAEDDDEEEEEEAAAAGEEEEEEAECPAFPVVAAEATFAFRRGRKLLSPAPLRVRLAPGRSSRALLGSRKASHAAAAADAAQSIPERN